jgi:hypothetical protein
VTALLLYINFIIYKLEEEAQSLLMVLKAKNPEKHARMMLADVGSSLMVF